MAKMYGNSQEISSNFWVNVGNPTPGGLVDIIPAVAGQRFCIKYYQIALRWAAGAPITVILLGAFYGGTIKTFATLEVLTTAAGTSHINENVNMVTDANTPVQVFVDAAHNGALSVNIAGYYLLD